MSTGEIAELLAQDGFLRSLFESIPCGVLVADQSGRVHAANDVIRQAFGPLPVALEARVGDVLHCLHAQETPEGCGGAEYCQGCTIRLASREALSGQSIQRTRATLDLSEGDSVDRRDLQISAAPLEHGGRQLAVVIVEDVTELVRLRRRLKAEQSFAGIVGRDPRMQELFETIRELADVDAPVLVQGESGTGKELVAAALHNEGPRAAAAFVAVNCSALPEGLLESELFGHVRGSFTGALRDKKGRFELADGGTIFLDEIGDLSPPLQVKLLRVLQEGIIEPVGAEDGIRVDVRVISATHKNLREELARGRFRADLFYRLCVVPITLPPLRERRGDIPLLAEHLLARATEQLNVGASVALSEEAISAMVDHEWPGNVRELENAVQYALIKCREGMIEPQHLPLSVTGCRPGQAALMRKRRRRKLRLAAVQRTLVETGGNRAEAARRLGVARATLYRFLEQMGTGE
ncbi:MAG: sigma 54-interacting transcriptional regulator [Candidatus Brocadiia bacterium]|nr:sigma 54-interacting transcriptional regulator [Candidatus Brocadiia bacterium]